MSPETIKKLLDKTLTPEQYQRMFIRFNESVKKELAKK